jgi:hypothetical protein
VIANVKRRDEDSAEDAVRAIFLSYRRDDSEGEAGRLFDFLTAEFGADKVFMDVTGIEPGRDFRKVVDQNVTSCGVLLALIGKGWIDAKDDGGRRRLDDPLDFVRLETASALKRDIPVIPVLVHGGRMPRLEQLPDDLKDLAYRNAVELTHARWDSDVQVLIKALRHHVDREPDEAGDAKAKPALDTSLSKRELLASKKAQVGSATSPASTQLTKRFWPRTVVAGLITLAIAAVVSLYEYTKIEKDKVRKAPTETPARQAADDEKVAAEREAASSKTTQEVPIAAPPGKSSKATQNAPIAVPSGRPSKPTQEIPNAAPRGKVNPPSIANPDTDQATSNLFVGKWLNQAPVRDGLHWFEIERIGGNVTIHLWAACEPTDCDLGVHKLDVTGTEATYALTVGNENRIGKISLVKPGLLNLAVDRFNPTTQGRLHHDWVFVKSN